ncbi:MAG: MmcQ/YjbR family DNA-binding protein [Acidobacteriota bacterium]|nr:MmcQ/YjbR family DNA-binding protein [Acidobacteriota bacterium]
MTADDFREIVLSMDGAAEGAHMKHPDFRANGRVFASLTPGEETAVVKLAPEEQQELMRINPKSFVPAAGAWGRQGWTMVPLAAAKKPVVRGAVLLAYQGIMSQPPPRRRKK